MNMQSKLKFLFPIYIYIAIYVGLYIFKSAWTAILAYHIGIVLVLLFQRPTNLWTKIKSGWDFKEGMILTLACSLAGGVLLLFLPAMQPDNSSLSSSLSALGLTEDTWILFVVYFSIIHPILEEIIWRGYICDNSKSKYPSLLDFTFAGYHILVLVWFVTIPWIAISFAVLAMASWIWQTTSTRNNGLLIPIVSHIAADLSVILAVTLIK